MHTAEQFDIDFAKAEAEWPLREQWERNRKAQADQWTNEALARHWAMGWDDKEGWNNLPRYERNRIVRMWENEQASLEFQREQWQPLCEVFRPDGTHGFYPPKPFRIRAFASVNYEPSKREMDDFHARAKLLADRLSADWSANRPPSEFTYDPMLASEVSLILGRKVEAIEAPLDACVPLSWRLLTAIEKQQRE